MRAQIRQFIQSNLTAFGNEALFEDSDNLFNLGFVNSLFAMKLVNFVEREFGIEVANEDLEIDNFSSVDNIVRFVERKRG